MLSRRCLILILLLLTGLTCLQAADITGKWSAEFDSQVGPQKYVFDLKADGTTITGKAISNIGGTEATTDITEGKINGNEIAFVENLDYQGMALRISYKGTVSGDSIQFSRMVGDQEGEKFIAKRAK